MMRNRAMTAATILVVLGFGRTTRAESIDEVAKKITDMYEKVRTLQFTSKSESDVRQEGMHSVTRSTGKTVLMRKDDRFLMRSEDKIETTMEVMGSKTTHKTDTLMIQDGQFVWSLDRVNNMATKMKAPENQPNIFDVKKVWADFNHKLLPDETVDGRPAWVIEASPKDAQMSASISKQVMWYEKKTGLMLKSISHGADGKPMHTMTLGDHKINESVDEKLFKFEPPEGVFVQDMTGELGK
jgi:outer membrane lipoprotein-sorting protein